MVREKFIVHTPDGEATFEDIELAKDFALTFTPADEVYIDRAIEDIDEVVVKETIISKEDLVDLMKSPFDMEYENIRIADNSILRNNALFPAFAIDVEIPLPNLRRLHFNDFADTQASVEQHHKHKPVSDTQIVVSIIELNHPYNLIV